MTFCSERNVPAAPSPAPAPGKMSRLRLLRLTGCEVVQIWDGSSSGSISKKKKLIPAPPSALSIIFERLRLPTKCAGSSSASLPMWPWPVADNSYKIDLYLVVIRSSGPFLKYFNALHSAFGERFRISSIPKVYFMINVYWSPIYDKTKEI